MKRLLPLGLVVLLCAGMSGECDGDLPMPPANCNTTWWSTTARAGFNPPEELIGYLGLTDHELLTWPLGSGLAGALFIFDSSIDDRSLEDNAAGRFSLLSINHFMRRNEAFVFNSGQAGWLLVSESKPGVPTARVLRVNAIIKVRSRIHELHARDFSENPDLEALMEVVRTFCAE